MVQSILVIGVGAPYDFLPEGQTERLKGRKVTYALRDVENSKDQLGLSVSQNSVPVEIGAKFKKDMVPCICDGAFSVTIKDGKPVMKLADIDEKTVVPVEL